MDPHKATFMVTEATCCLAHTYMFNARPTFSKSLFCYIHPPPLPQSHTHTAKLTQGPLLPLLFQLHATSNAYSHTGEALCARGRNNCGSSCTVTFNP